MSQTREALGQKQRQEQEAGQTRFPKEPLRAKKPRQTSQPTLLSPLPWTSRTPCSPESISAYTFSLDKWPCQVLAQQDLSPTSPYPQVCNVLTPLGKRTMSIPEGQSLHGVSLWVAAFKPSEPVLPHPLQQNRRVQAKAAPDE